jgi:membrane protein insertase Oxa1/YidC/SpoIIIJ
MDISPVIFWNIVLTLIIAPAFWGFRSLVTEMKRIDILLNKTREEYATRTELRDDMRQVMEALHRVEDKLDKALERTS